MNIYQTECILIEDLTNKKSIIEKYKNALYTLVSEPIYTEDIGATISKIQEKLNSTLSYTAKVMDSLGELREHSTIEGRDIEELTIAQFHRLYDDILCTGDTAETVELKLDNFLRNMGVR